MIWTSKALQRKCPVPCKSHLPIPSRSRDGDGGRNSFSPRILSKYHAPKACNKEKIEGNEGIIWKKLKWVLLAPVAMEAAVQ